MANFFKWIKNQFSHSESIEGENFSITGNGVVHVEGNELMESSAFKKQLNKLKRL